MREVSIVWLDANASLIKPLREKLGEHLCYCYSVTAPQNINNLNASKICFSTLPFIVRKMVDFLSCKHLLPRYYGYLIQHYVMDFIFSRRIEKDESILVYVHCSCKRCIRRAQQKGKIVVTMAGNAEPMREYKRITEEYNNYNIKRRYIYGDIKYQTRIKNNIAIADKVISISKVSEKTYFDAGYDMTHFHFIPLTGTDFPIQSTSANLGKQKVVITTAFHNFIKGTHRLLLAWKKAEIKNIPLIIVGRQCEDMQEFIDKYGPFDNVKFIGYVKESLTDFYKQFDAVGVLLSLSEGAVRTTPELMSFGFPMIVSPDATCDIVEDGINGFIVEPKNEEEIVEKLRWFAEDWERVEQFRESVLSSVSHRTVKEFSEDCADYLIELTNTVKN